MLQRWRAIDSSLRSRRAASLDPNKASRVAVEESLANPDSNPSRNLGTPCRPRLARQRVQYLRTLSSNAHHRRETLPGACPILHTFLKTTTVHEWR